jgi:RNA polymerase sigma factor (sigma-70 family)
MKESPLSGFIRSLRGSRLLAGQADLEDRQLLERFLAERDETAFELILRRHGPMVLGVCRRVLNNLDDAEDAFQATFLVLVRKARTLHSKELLGKWLFGVATRTACKARTLSARRRKHETVAATKERDRSDNLADRSALSAWIDEEVGRLPEKYRLPVIFCHLQGMTLEEASRKLGWPIGTVSGRLSRARALLKKRIARRAVAPLAGLREAALMENLGFMVVPSTLLRTTLDTAAAMAAGRTAAGAGVSAAVMLLTKGVIHEMFWNQIKTVMVVFLAAGVLGGVSTVVLGQRALPQEEVKKEQAKPEEPFKEYVARIHEQLLKPRQIPPGGDGLWKVPEPEPLPGIDDQWLQSALKSARVPESMKTTLQARHDAAEIELDGRWKEFFAGRGTLNILFGACERMLHSEADVSQSKEYQIRLLETHVKRLQKILDANKKRFEEGRIPAQDVAQSEFYYQDAKLRLERAKAP